MEGEEHLDDKFRVEYFPVFLTEAESEELYGLLVEEITSTKKVTPGRRVNITYGDPGVSYTVNFKNGSVTRTAMGWDTSEAGKLLYLYSKRLEDRCGLPSNYVVVQYYPTGKAHIAPHRDSEMGSASIAGVSMGATRTLTMYPTYKVSRREPITIPLGNGSLYVLIPPTNEYWLHSIDRDDSITEGRISLTYRAGGN